MSYQDERQSVPIVMPSERADVLDKIQPGKVVEEIRMRLLGKLYTNGKWIEQEYMKGIALSNIGAWQISTLMYPASSQNTAMTKFNPNQIKARLLNIVKTAQKMCIRNWKEYNIQSIDQLYFVHEIVMTNTLAALNQPEGEGMRRFVGNVSNGEIGYAEPEQGGMNMFRPQ